jgi:predicted lysophospholipase L1 biosynthesis ABC-type transport system permease subunit
VVITEAFAGRFWPGEDAVGRRLRPSPHHPWYDVVGVVSNIRTRATRPADSTDRAFNIYGLWQPHLRPTAESRAPPRATGGLAIPERHAWMDSPDRADAVSRRRGPSTAASALSSTRDDACAGAHADTLLATRVVGAFAGLAFVVAMVGVYGVMAYLVAGRTREIGIRMALGADARDISRLVLRSAVTMVGIGAAIGIAGALVAARWTASQFFGVTATSPGIYIGVTSVILVTSILATWRPARQAARIDPARTLNS